jgi:hypothetical protein
MAVRRARGRAGLWTIGTLIPSAAKTAHFMEFRLIRLGPAVGLAGCQAGDCAMEQEDGAQR